MSLLWSLCLVLELACGDLGEAFPHMPVVPVSLMERQADGVVIATVKAGMLGPDTGTARYLLSTESTIRGGFQGDFCVQGPHGLKLGTRHLMFIKSMDEKQDPDMGCRVVGSLGHRVPYALEITERWRHRRDDGRQQWFDLVWFNDERIFYPYFERVVFLSTSPYRDGWGRQEMDARGDSLGVGGLLPLQDFMDHVNGLPISHAVVEPVPPGGTTAILDFMVKRMDMMLLLDIKAAHVRSAQEKKGGDIEPGSRDMSYKADGVDAMSGDVLGVWCIQGSPGLKLGSRYLVFVSKSDEMKTGDPECVFHGSWNSYVPPAVEVVERKEPSGSGAWRTGKYVRLNDHRVLYPHFENRIELSVVRVRPDASLSKERVGALIPFDDFIEYVSLVRASHTQGE